MPDQRNPMPVDSSFNALPTHAPGPGQLVQVRSRRWLVEEVIQPEAVGESPLVRMACADDDAQEQAPDVYWDYEIDRRILEAEGWQNLAAQIRMAGCLGERGERGRMGRGAG